MLIKNKVMSEDATSTAEVMEEPIDGASAMSTILNAVKENPTLAEDPEIKNVIDMAQGKKESKKTKQPESTDYSEPAQEPEKPQSESKSESDSNSMFFKEQESEEEPESVDVSSIEDALSHIKEKYSIDDMDTFFSSADKWRRLSQDTEQSHDKLDDIQEAFTKMPDSLFNAFNSWANGGDWKSSLSGVGSGLDYSADFADYNTYDMVNYYFPQEYEKDEFENNMNDTTIKRAVTLAENQYATEKKSFEDERASYMNQAEERQALLKDSTTSSVEILKESFPDFGKKALKKVKDTMISGDLNNLFFNRDGSYSKDAAIKVALALFGKDEIKRAKGRADKSQEVLRSNVNRSDGKPSVKSTQGQQAQIPEEVTGIFKDVFVKKYY